jgi:hypothetical protein
MRDGADRGHRAKRDRQVVMAALLGQIGGREVDCDPSRRQREPGGDHRRAHPLTRLGNRLVGKADDGEGRHARCNLHLDIDGSDLDAFERNRRDALDPVDPALGAH